MVAIGLGVLNAELSWASWMVPPYPIRAKDFTLVKRDGTYHLFYIRNDTSLPANLTERDLGHAVSNDLYQWTQLDPVMAVSDGGWDSSHVWAPSIIERDSVYYLFYTGVADEPGTYGLHQRIGIATSTDLVQWNRMDRPVFTCDGVPWCWCDTTSGAPFRDPFVTADPSAPGRWLMLYSTAPDSDRASMVVGVAASDGDFTRWTELGPLWITYQAYSYNDLVESPHLFEHAGLSYLVFTTSAGQPLSFATSADPFGGLAGWIYRGRLSNMLNLDTRSWYASEFFRDGDVDYFGLVNGQVIEVLRILWQPDWGFTLAQPDLFHVQRMNWSLPLVRAGEDLTLQIKASGWYGRSAQIDAFQKDSTGLESTIPPGDLGLPADIPLDADTTNFTWMARGLSDSSADSSGVEIVLRLRDRTCEAAPLRVLPAPEPPPPPPPPPSPEPTRDPTTMNDPEGRDALGPGPRLRILRNGMLGAGTALLADLPAAAPARLDLFDVQGRRLRTLVSRDLPRGASVIAWDGRDARGASLPRGIYFARLTTPRAVRTARIVLLRP